MFLSCDPFFHEPDIPLLLFDGAALRPQQGLKDMVQLDLIGNMILGIEAAKAMNFCSNAWVIQ